MASFNKFNIFTKDLVSGVHNFGTATIKLVLTNSAPSASNALLADITDLSTANGYTAGGATPGTVTVSTSSGTAKVTIADTVITASGGTIGPFRYAVLYNSTPTSPLKPLVGYWDYGSSITLQDGESLTADFDDSNGVFTVA